MPATSNSSTEPARRLRIVSWNCHGAIGRDGRCDPERTLAVIAALDPDILALQEVDGRSHLGRRPLAFEFFAARLGGHLVEARTVLRERRDYGHLLWSRDEVLDSRVHALPGGVEPRAAVDARCRTALGPVRVIATHLGLGPATRRAQARFVASAIGPEDGHVVALGDFNEWRRGGAVDAVLSDRLPVRVSERSWPARWPLVHLDRLYASSGLRATVRAAPAWIAAASDHLPLVVDLLPAEPA
ncbi:endonuclease/exonuclease/phosphatase family protein [Aurantimonas sp. HBX-1]|uniref:endonuclease/exonuclease/phosphatase family protein n=1 Tax=Aurantimonas sp. HBX-1 TaxID=2906072 RepID=UPI001F1C8753|nr:endonuclease/exonuclease/phosphatase family protein [Aurantimonas sp. HBX-1]UIJ70924.1 endonuclease/exonuclease/phosphatase family protein [Aurantimonas sp. HBX-1]